MPIFRLIEDHIFPAPEQSREDGLLAVGGDLHPARLLLAYQMGIFPWYNEDQPILWWSPDPRLVLYPDKLRISKSLKQVLKKELFSFSFDTMFEDVIRHCSSVKREGQGAGTWITEDMIDAYCELHRLGFAHSVEVMIKGKLVGGLYGVSIGNCFSGESMFSLESNASKAGFTFLVTNLQKTGYSMVDCQVETPYLTSFGAELIDRDIFLNALRNISSSDGVNGKWTSISKSNGLSSGLDILDYHKQFL